MKLVAFTICLDGGEFIKKHLPIFERLSIPFEWIVVEGASGNTADTSWCAEQKPRLSEDGTHEYLQSIKDERVTHIFKEHWSNKTEMCNAALERITEPCVLLQSDVDEFFHPSQLESIVQLFEQRPELSSIMFACRYYVGDRLLLEGEHCYGDMDYEWLRAWRYEPGRRYLSHEPPVLEGDDPARRISKEESRKLGLIFDHYPYVTEQQVAYKEQFYNYTGLLTQWRVLQRHEKFPVSLSRFFSFLSSSDTAIVTKV